MAVRTSEVASSALIPSSKLYNMAMENEPFEDVFPINKG